MLKQSLIIASTVALFSYGANAMDGLHAGEEDKTLSHENTAAYDVDVETNAYIYKYNQTPDYFEHSKRTGEHATTRGHLDRYTMSMNSYDVDMDTNVDMSREYRRDIQPNRMSY